MGYQNTREGIRGLYHQVYKLRRLPGSLACGPEQVCEFTRDVVSSLKNCLRWRGGKQPRGHEVPEPTDTRPSQDKTSQRMRWGTSAKRELAEAREAHQQILAAAAALEERIERLSWSTTRSWTDAQVPSGVATDKGEDPRGGAGGATGPYQRTAQSLLPHIVPLSGAQRHQRTRRLNCPS